MKNYIKNLICKFHIHFPILLYLSFWDKIDGKVVLKFECNNCQKNGWQIQNGIILNPIFSNNLVI